MSESELCASRWGVAASLRASDTTRCVTGEDYDNDHSV
jgi:hypothetical protein